jgi:hypothetical protein
MEHATRVLAAIADAYDENELDDEARKYPEPRAVADPSDIELYAGRGGRRLLTLADCLKAREEREVKGSKKLSLEPLPPPLTGDWQHIKSGRVYTVNCIARRESDLEPVVVYFGHGEFWVRPYAEFTDGRFKKIQIGR